MTAQALLTGSEWVPTGDVLEVANKYTGEVYATVALSDDAQTDRAVAAASNAFERVSLSPHQRYEILARAADLVAERRAELVADIVGESGFTRKDADTEVTRATVTLRLSAEEATRLTGELVPIEGAPGVKGKFAFTQRKPLGVVCAITPFNSPLNTLLHKVGPAIAAGNAVVLKPSVLTPVTAVRICEIFRDAGLPEGWLNLVIGPGSTAGQQLLRDERIAFYHFTGSTETGRIVRREIGLRGAALELGNISATIVCADGDVALAAKQCAPSAYRKAGQVCTSVQLIYVHEDVFDDFLQRFQASTEALAVGDPADERTEVGPLIAPTEADRVQAWIEEARHGGARVVTGGERDRSVIQPTVLTDVAEDHAVVCKEVFGPVASVIPFTDLDEAIGRVNRSPYGLAAGAYTRDLVTFSKLAHGVRTGTLHINSTSSSRVDLMPFGGVKLSGNGKEGPHYAVREMTEERLIVLHELAS